MRTLHHLAWLVACLVLACGTGSPTLAGSPDGTGGGGGTEGSAAGAAGASASSAGSAGISGAAGHSGSAGAPPGRPSDELCGRRPGGPVHETHVLRFENEAQDVVVQLRRTFEGNGVGESYLFGLEAFDLKLGDTTQCTSSPEALAYDNTHHNWADAASASVGSIRYELSIVFSTDSLEWSATLTGYDERDAVVFEPLVLIPTGGPTNCFSCPNRTEALITEIMPNNGSVLSDEASEYPPWIELCHMSASGSVNFDGWWLSDALHDRRRWPLPPVELTGLECLVVLADSDVDQGELHANFELSPEGGELVLTDPRGVTDGGFVYQAQAEDVSLLWSWTDSSYVASEEPTPGLLNQTE